jgi:glycosyltransferase involved in cell wall biosynthesis
MKASIVTVCLNSEQTIEGTIRSVAAQDYREIEYIVVDGGSTDSTLDILRRHNASVGVLVSEPDAGIYDAMNKGLGLATGDVVAFLNSDDEYVSPDTVGRILSVIREQKVDAAYGDLVYVDRKTPHIIRRRWIAGPYREGRFSSGWVPPHPTFFCRKSVYDRFGGFDARFRIAGDFELMLRFVVKHRIQLGYLNRVLVRMGTGGRASRLSGMLRGNGEILKAFGVNGLSFPWQLPLCRPLSRLRQIVGVARGEEKLGLPLPEAHLEEMRGR